MLYASHVRERRLDQKRRRHTHRGGRRVIVELGRSEVVLAAVRRIAEEVAGAHADDVDLAARFPNEAIDALREERLLSALVPEALGGIELPFEAVAEACFELGRRCGATGLIFAMHQIQVATLVRHLTDAPSFEQYLRDLAEGETRRISDLRGRHRRRHGSLDRRAHDRERQVVLVREARSHRELRGVRRRHPDDPSQIARRGAGRPGDRPDPRVSDDARTDEQLESD